MPEMLQFNWMVIFGAMKIKRILFYGRDEVS